MSQENQITLRGYVTAEPKFWHTTPTRTPVAEIRIGSTPRRLNRATGEWQDADTTYYKIKCWRRLAVNVACSLRKGDRVIIRGKFTTRQWLDDQQRPRAQIEVEADTVGHDLQYGWSRFIRGVQTPQDQWQPGADGGQDSPGVTVGDEEDAEPGAGPVIHDQEYPVAAGDEGATAEPATAGAGLDALDDGSDTAEELAHVF